jgi:hypothetical protein
MAPSQNYPLQQLNCLAQNPYLNQSPQQNGSVSLLRKVFSIRCGTGENGTRRNRSGLIGGEWVVRISRRRNSGLRRFLLMLVSDWRKNLLVIFIDNFILDADYDPVKVARDERKARVAKNEKKKLGNQARAAPSEREQRKKEIDTTLATTRISTASMGKFDKKLEGEKKMRGVKRKVI